MRIKLKLYAMLGEYLPKTAIANEAEISLEGDMTVLDVLNKYCVPLEQCHLVLVNGVFIEPSARVSRMLEENDHLAVWPPIAGG